MTVTKRTATRTTASFSRSVGLKAVIGWFVEADRRYREFRRLRQMPDVRLKDMGMTRKEADHAFLTG